MEGTDPEKKKVPIDKKLDDIENSIAQTRQDLLDALKKGFSDIKKILTSETW